MTFDAWQPVASDPFSRTAGVLPLRVIAYFLDLVSIGLISLGVWLLCVFITVFSLGLLRDVWQILPFTALLYLILTIGGPHAATWGMRITGIAYRRLDGRRPDYLQALAVSLLFYFTVGATGGLILLVPLFTTGNRTLHDILAGLIMVQDRPFEI